MGRRAKKSVRNDSGPSRPPRPDSPSFFSRHAVLLSASLIVLAGLAAYANSFQGALVFDDGVQIVENPHIRQLWPPGTAVSDTPRPLGMWTFAVNYALSGENPWSYHAANLAIHLAAALVFFDLVRRTLSRVGQGREGLGGTAQTGQPAVRKSAEKHAGSATEAPPAARSACPTLQSGTAAALALAVALLWTVHPLNTQAVTYIVQRLESLMGLFYLLTLYSFVRAQDARRPVAWYAASVGFCALGMGTKEVMVTAPLIVLWYDRALVAASWRALGRRWKYYAALAGTWLVLAALMLSRRGDYATGDLIVVKDLSPFRYGLTEPGVIVHYLRLSVWPVGLCFDYAWPPARTAAAILPPLAAIAALLGITIWCVFRRPAWGFLGGWFFLILAPTSSVVPIVDPAFEHRMYLPLAGVVVAAVFAVAALLRTLVRRDRLAPRMATFCGAGITITLVVVLAVLTCRRNADYSSELRIWQDTAAKAPRNARAYFNIGVVLGKQGEKDAAAEFYRRALGVQPDHVRSCYNLALVLTDRGQIEEATALYRKALEVMPEYVDARNNLGNLLTDRGQADEAIGHFREVLRVQPNHAATHVNLGRALAARGRRDEALAEFRRALALKSELAEAHTHLGIALAAAGQVEEGMAEFRRALELKPDDATAHYNLGYALAGRGELGEAIAHYRKALQAKADYANAHFNLAIALDRRGKPTEALEHFRAAARLQPNHPVMLNALAWLLATGRDSSVRNGPEAVELARRAVQRTDGRDPAALDTLAAALAECGQFAEAAATAEQALALVSHADRDNAAGGASSTVLAEGLRSRIKLYQAGKPFHEGR